MGILESCQGVDSRMSVSLDNNSFRELNIQKYSHEDFYYQNSKINLFGDIFYKKALSKTQFVLQTNHINRNAQVINVALNIYEDSNRFLLQKGSKIKILHCIDDPNSLQQRFYIIKYSNHPGEMMLKTIPFNRYEQQKFKKGLYQIYMLQKNIKEQNNKFGYSYRDSFVIQSGLDKDLNDKCLIILGDHCNVTLAELITYRKLVNISWKEKEFQILCTHLIKGLIEIHKKGIAHRDIRPYNIFYSPVKKTFLIGGMQNAIIVDKSKMSPQIGFNLSGVPYYMPRYLLKIGKKQDFSQYYNYDPFRNDIYSLGLTLLNALFLDQFMPIQVFSSSLKKLQSKYSYLNLIKSMVSTTEAPPSLSFLLDSLHDNLAYNLQQDNNIKGLRYNMKPQDEQFVNNKKKIANGYYQMFIYDQWVQQINQVVNYYQLNNDNIQLAEIYKKIADIYSQHHQEQMMNQYYTKASHIYLKISADCLEEKKVSQAIKYLEKGIQCNRKGYRGRHNQDLAYLLNKLAKAHHIKAEYQIARAFQEQALQIIGKTRGQNSLAFADMLIDSAKIQSDFQQFKQAQNMLKVGLKITDKGQQTIDVLKIRARLLQALGNNYRMKAIQRRDKCQVYRNKAEEHLLDSLKLIQQLQGSIHPQVGSILMSLGNVYFDKRQFGKAKKSYEQSLTVKQHTLKGRFHVEVGECLTYLANSQKCLKQYQKAIKHYDQAIQVFRKSYGNDHNENTAVAIGNLGLVYKQLGRRSQERQYLSLAKSILKDLYGQQCPDYQYFDRQMTR